MGEIGEVILGEREIVRWIAKIEKCKWLVPKMGGRPRKRGTAARPSNFQRNPVMHETARRRGTGLVCALRLLYNNKNLNPRGSVKISMIRVSFATHH